jgi:hypothetical protein
MPNFKKSTGYKMKGSKFYGAGNQSPLKAVDSAVIDSQKELNKTEDTFRQPGWARVAGSIEKMAKGPLGKFKDKIMGDGGGGGGGGGAAKVGKASKSVSDIASENDLEVNEDLMGGAPAIR